jgi:uroporphyrinogen-III decarboxylase
MHDSFFQELAASGNAVPVATHLLLHEQPDSENAVCDAAKLALVIEQTADRFNTPLAIPLMDLTIEKNAIIGAIGVALELLEKHHLDSPVSPEQVEVVIKRLSEKPAEKMKAVCGALQVLSAKNRLFPVGMCIGPFSLMTKLLADPITPVFMYGTGTAHGEDRDVDTMLSCLDLATRVVKLYAKMQIDAGAKAVFVCEPAANRVYISPSLISNESGDLFDKTVIDPLSGIASMLRENGTAFILHDCGELEDTMVRKLASLSPEILSLGSSRKLWDDARLTAENTVLYGNLPSRYFYDDVNMTVEEVERRTRELCVNMRKTGRAFICGTECDVLHVEKYSASIKAKVDAMVETARQVMKREM